MSLLRRIAIIAGLLFSLGLGCGARTAMQVSDASRPADLGAPAVDLGSDAGPLRSDAGADAGSDAGVDGGPCTPGTRRLTVAFTPTKRLSFAIWITSGTRLQTLALTEAVALRGIGNRPGAQHMNSGFRWPYGRRETVLPLWARARAASGAALFRRVVFTNRPEGRASATAEDPRLLEPYFCLSFQSSTTRRDTLDAVSCASQFFGDPGRYLRPDETDYREPLQVGLAAGQRVLPQTSLYPPRREMGAAVGAHPDVARFASDALAAMPELDAISTATPAGDARWVRTFELPSDWPAGATTVHVEANAEGDYGAGFGPERSPTPNEGGTWDYWAMEYGYPYRGQPSVLYEVTLDGAGAGSARAPTQVGPLDAIDGPLPAVSEVVDDPRGAPGSGADRLRAIADGVRLAVTLEGCVR